MKSATNQTLARTECGECPIRHRAVCSTCETDELQTLDAIKSYRSWSAGETILLEGEVLNFAASVVSGCATLTRSLEDGRTQMVGLLLPSDFLGRPGRKRTAYRITAATDITLCMFRRSEFERLLREVPHLGDRLLEMALDELDAAREWMLLLGRKTAREKVATFLLMILRRATLDGGPARAELPITRESIASYLGLTIETVSRQMTALRKAGIIEMDGLRSVSSRDLDLLAEAAGEDSDGAILD